MLRALLSNIQAMAKPSAAAKSTTSNFDRKWGDQAAFKKNIDKGTNTAEFPDQDQKAQIHEQILVMYKTSPAKSGRDRSSFLKKMAGESMDFIQEQRSRLLKTRQEEQLCHNSMAALT